MARSARYLVEDAVAGDRRARGHLFREHLPGLRAFVRAQAGPRLSRRESSMDLVNSVCREALLALPQFEYRGPLSFRNWLFRQAQSKIRDRGRYWNRERRTADREAGDVSSLVERVAREGGGIALQVLGTPSRHACAREELVRLDQALRALPEAYRRVILLSRVESLPHAEIARRMGRSQAATRTLLSRALARLATRMEDAGEREPD